MFEHHDKFVAPKPRHRIALANAGGQPVGHLFQQLVAHVMPQGVVQVLEVVQINEQQRATGLAASASYQGLGQTVQQQAPVWQTGQRVIKRQPHDLVLVLFLGGHIPANAPVAAKAAVRIKNRRAADRGPHDGAVLQSPLHLEIAKHHVSLQQLAVFGPLRLSQAGFGDFPALEPQKL